MSDAQAPHDEPLGPSFVPLFPLPGVVLFPRAILPLHIFEERYKAMMRHALEGDRRIAMAMLRPGWQQCYYQKPAIEPVVCVGKILSHERLPDGKYNFLLQGQMRGRVIGEIENDPYRIARVEPMEEFPADDADDTMAVQRERIREAFAEGPLASTPVGKQFVRLLEAPLPTADIADLIAFHFVEDVELKQSLLADAVVPRRVERAVDALELLLPSTLSASVRASRNPGIN